jgi:hypothetical protein
MQREARAHVDQIHARARISANASIGRYYAKREFERKQQLAKDVARHAPGWAKARERWAAEADAREVIQRVAFSDQPPTKDELAAFQRYLETQVEKET